MFKIEKKCLIFWISGECGEVCWMWDSASYNYQ